MEKKQIKYIVLGVIVFLMFCGISFIIGFYFNDLLKSQNIEESSNDEEVVEDIQSEVDECNGTSSNSIIGNSQSGNQTSYDYTFSYLTIPMVASQKLVTINFTSSEIFTNLETKPQGVALGAIAFESENIKIEISSPYEAFPSGYNDSFTKVTDHPKYGAIYREKSDYDGKYYYVNDVSLNEVCVFDNSQPPCGTKIVKLDLNSSESPFNTITCLSKSDIGLNTCDEVIKNIEIKTESASR